MRAGKVWGQTEKIKANGVLELHRIEATAGSRCSMHKHEHKWNGFYVEAGLLKIITRKNDYDLVDETILGPGDYTEVPPGEFHRFEALEDTVAFELYWAAELKHNDIEREDVGRTTTEQNTSSEKGCHTCDSSSYYSGPPHYSRYAAMAEERPEKSTSGFIEAVCQSAGRAVFGG